MHLGEDLNKVCVFALVRKTPLPAVLARQLGVRRRAHGSVEAKDPRVIGAGSVVGVIDAPIDLARLRAHGRRLCDPFAWSSHARTLDKLLIGAVQPLDAAMSVVVLRGPPHRGNDGVSAAPRSSIGDALPYRAVGAALELAQLLAVVGDVAEKARNHGGRSCGIRLRRVPENGSYNDPL